MRYGTNKEKNTKLGEGLRRLAKESHGIRKERERVHNLQHNKGPYWSKTGMLYSCQHSIYWHDCVIRATMCRVVVHIMMTMNMIKTVTMLACQMSHLHTQWMSRAIHVMITWLDCLDDCTILRADGHPLLHADLAERTRFSPFRTAHFCWKPGGQYSALESNYNKISN